MLCSGCQHAAADEMWQQSPAYRRGQMEGERLQRREKRLKTTIGAHDLENYVTLEVLLNSRRGDTLR